MRPLKHSSAHCCICIQSNPTDQQSLAQQALQPMQAVLPVHIICHCTPLVTACCKPCVTLCTACPTPATRMPSWQRTVILSMPPWGAPPTVGAKLATGGAMQRSTRMLRAIRGLVQSGAAVEQAFVRVSHRSSGSGGGLPCISGVGLKRWLPTFSSQASSQALTCDEVFSQRKEE